MATSTSNQSAIVSARNPIIYELNVQDEPILTMRQAVIYIQSLVGGIFDLPINANAPLIAINRNNSYSFNLQAILENNPHFQSVARPSLTSPIARKLNNFALDYQVQSKIISQEVILKSETFTAINAKNPFGDRQDFFQKRLNNDNFMFLQGGPRYRIVSEQSPSFLYFLFNLDPCPEGAIIVVEFFRDDFSLISTEDFYEIHGIKQNDVFEFNVSLDKLQDIIPAESFSHYSVSLKLFDEAANIAEQYSETFKYYIDESITDLPERNLYFKNLYGVWDTFRITEANINTTDFQREVFSNEKMEVLDNTIETTDKISISSGVMSQGWLQYLNKNLCTSKEIYLSDENDTARLRCITQSIEDDSFKANEQVILEFEVVKKQLY